jgi:N-acetylglutamate synthase-like GNAT family acetyltransferase
VDVTLKQQPDLLEIEIFYQARKGNFWIATHENQLIGTLALLDTKDGILVLRKMFVHKDYRGAKTSIAAKLLQISIIWAQKNDISNM